MRTVDHTIVTPQSCYYQPALYVSFSFLSFPFSPQKHTQVLSYIAFTAEVKIEVTLAMERESYLLADARD